MTTSTAMAGSNIFDLLASDDENDFEHEPIVETVSSPTLNSSAQEPEESFDDFYLVAKKEKRRNPTPAGFDVAGPCQHNLPGPSERFSTSDSKGDTLRAPKSKSDKWTTEKAAEMKEQKAESKARKAELAREHSIQSKNPQWRRERAADLKARKAKAKAHKEEAKTHRNCIKKLEKEAVGKGAAKKKKQVQAISVPEQ